MSGLLAIPVFVMRIGARQGLLVAFGQLAGAFGHDPHRLAGRALKRPRLLEANDVVPFTSPEIVRIIAACNEIGRAQYERLRARAMVLLMRYAGLRVSDVVTLSRDHIKGSHLEKRAVKNRRMIRVDLHPDVVKALDLLPHPKAAERQSTLYFSGEHAALRSLVKGAQRTLAAVFKRAEVDGGHPHRFRHTLASEILGKGGIIEDAASILADSPATIRRHYAKWTPGVPNPSGQGNADGSWHKSGTDGKTSC